MAQKAGTLRRGEKRRATRSLRNVEPTPKKAKISSPAQTPQSTAAQSPAVQTPAPSTPQPTKRPPRLPPKLVENRPLPALPEAQSLSLPKSEYQSIAASAVLQTSLDRSRAKWAAEGVLQRYWTKPETGKYARPPPPNNPEVKWQKHQGPCRVRIEPHILEADLYVEQKPKQLQQVKQYVPHRPSQPFSQQPHQSPFNSPKPLSPMQPTLQTKPIQGAQTPNSTQPRPFHTQSPAPRVQQPPPLEKKPTTDPVISMLASRASSDPVLKALMKEVANGNATQEQLKVFQAHIDELTRIINENKKREGEAQAAKIAAQGPQQQNDGIKYDAPVGATPVQPTSRPFQQTPLPPPPPPYRPNPSQYQPPPPPPPPPPQPVILAFTCPGASEDRFLFPQYTILESLSPQHLLASFICTRKGREAIDQTGLDPDVEYWQPVTLMVEVAYKREHFLDFIKRWVKPADEVRQHMEETIKRCTRAPINSLVLRLPFKGTDMAETDDMPPDIAPPLPEVEENPKPKVKYARKKAITGTADATSKTAVPAAVKPEPEVTSTNKDSTTKEPKSGETCTVVVENSSQNTDVPIKPPANEAESPAPATSQEPLKDGESTTSTSIATSNLMTTDKAASLEQGRPKRAVRKSVRISEG